jgi:hypothetical protein
MFGFLFSAAWQWFLGLFGVSDSQKLGRAERDVTTLKANLKAKEEEARVMEAPARPESVVDDELRRHAGK